MRNVKNTVDTGRMVVCTIHQRIIHIFKAFDEVLSLSLSLRETLGSKFIQDY
ncbi:hypothetical protein GIB67_021980 [Kingdonia uniflora]|uniref:Uncharacterized protein n=1 Tax=Kingdonia uniflora TaxID=39325 RepID=A0A7J7P819_9MAGN|nr:hypothetical protein GIB67_021980 [Kingdonia uniflora]